MIIVIDARDAQLARVGVAVYCSNIIAQLELLAGSKHDFIYLTSPGLPNPIVKGTVLSIAPSSKDSFYTKLIWYFKLPKLLKRLEADLYFGNFIPLPFQRNFECAVVTTAHDAASINTTELVGNSFTRYRNKYFVSGWISRATNIICISEYCKSEFSEIFGDRFSKKSTVIHHGLPMEFKGKFRPDSLKISHLRRDFSNNKSYILSIGTVTPKKNYARLIESLSKIADKDIHLIVCGSNGYGAEEIISLPAKFHVADRVHFLSGLSTDVVYDLMCGAECFVFPSLYEGFGIPLLEAFSVGTPVISSNATCLPEIANNAAQYFDPYSIESIVNAIDTVLQNEDVKAMLTANGYERVKRFTWERSAQQHLAIFEKSLLDQK